MYYHSQHFLQSCDLMHSYAGKDIQRCQSGLALLLLDDSSPPLQVVFGSICSSVAIMLAFTGALHSKQLGITTVGK